MRAPHTGRFAMISELGAILQHHKLKSERKWSMQWNSKRRIVGNIFDLATFCMSLLMKPFHKMVPSRSGATWLVVWHNHRVWISIQISETLQQSLFAVQSRTEIASTLRKGWIYPPSFCTWPPVSSLRTPQSGLRIVGRQRPRLDLAS